MSTETFPFQSFPNAAASSEFGPASYRPIYGSGYIDHMMMVVPIDPYIGKADDIAQECRQQRHQLTDVISVRNMQLQYHNGNNDSEDPIAKCLQPSFFHDR